MLTSKGHYFFIQLYLSTTCTSHQKTRQQTIIESSMMANCISICTSTYFQNVLQMNWIRYGWYNSEYAYFK